MEVCAPRKKQGNPKTRGSGYVTFCIVVSVMLQFLKARLLESVCGLNMGVGCHQKGFGNLRQVASPLP